MTGAFDALADKYELSGQVAADLLEKIDNEHLDVVVASGTSCRHQISDLTKVRPKHMAELLAGAIGNTVRFWKNSTRSAAISPSIEINFKALHLTRPERSVVLLEMVFLVRRSCSGRRKSATYRPASAESASECLVEAQECLAEF